MDKISTALTSISKGMGIIIVLVSLITYVYSIGQLSHANAIDIESNRCLIKEVKTANIEIQLQLKEIETHLVYIKRSLDE